MLVKLGQQRRQDTVAGRLLDCHDRIRHFSELASKIGALEDPPLEEVQRAAQEVRRYFTEALPLHVADEEESILPRLHGRDPSLDAALDRMRAEHARHEAPLARVMSICETLASSPERLTEVRAALIEAAAELDRELRLHLEEEERDIFPALDTHLDEQARAEIVNEMASRRDR